MSAKHFSLDHIHPSWHECLQLALTQLNHDYVMELTKATDWLPGPSHIFNAFSLPLPQVNYVLFGESPYPRSESANGYAFWDASVHELWSSTGLSKKVNRATSLRNMIKMLLIAEGVLDASKCAQTDIAHLTKSSFIQTNDELFHHLLDHGFLLLNATPVFRTKLAQKDARAWRPFMKTLLAYLLEKKPDVTFVLLGRIAGMIDEFISPFKVNKIYAEHPYNLSFITNSKILEFFEPLHLLKKTRMFAITP